MSNNMHQFQIQLKWPADAAQMAETLHPDATFSRNAVLSALGKASVLGSAPAVFSGDATRYNPEELLLMSLSQCHMLTYLAIASKKRMRVIGYTDEASGTLALGQYGTTGKMSMQEVVLRPRVVVAEGVDIEEATALHEKAHANCFMANSVNFPVRCEPIIVVDE
jgi:organic hydroperoxide reductase OsmC/OhrA